MIAIKLVLGFGIGAILGALVWLTSRYFIAAYTDAASMGQKISLRDFISASGLASVLGMATWGGYVAWRLSEIDLIIATSVTTAILLVVVLVDYQVRRIPNKMVIVLLLWSTVQLLWLGRPSPRSALLGVVVGGIAFLLLAILGRGALGMGDVKFIAAVGALLGYPLILYSMFWGIMFGGLAAFLLLATKRAGRKDSFAYGPYLALGAWMIFLGTVNLLPWQH